MRFFPVLFLAIWQLTAIPFVAVLTSNTIKAESAPAADAQNHTIIFKTAGSDLPAYE